MAIYRVLCNVCETPPKRIGERKTSRGARMLRSRHLSSGPHQAAVRRYYTESVRILSPV